MCRGRSRGVGGDAAAGGEKLLDHVTISPEHVGGVDRDANHTDEHGDGGAAVIGGGCHGSHPGHWRWARKHRSRVGFEPGKPNNVLIA